MTFANCAVSRILVRTSMAVLVLLAGASVFDRPAPLRGVGVVQTYPEASAKVFVRQPGILDRLKARDGQEVKQGEELAEFSNSDLNAKLAETRAQKEIKQKDLAELRSQREKSDDRGERSRGLFVTQQDAIAALSHFGNHAEAGVAP